MKPFRYLFFALASLSLLTTSCGGDDPDEPAPVQIPIHVNQSSVADGSTVSADLKEITFTFSTSVTATSQNICFLNGNNNPYTVNINKVTASLSLKPGTAYELSFPEGPSPTRPAPSPTRSSSPSRPSPRSWCPT